MLFSKITANHEKYQKRDTKVSSRTVEAILREGINLAKFQPIPLFPVKGGQWCVAGDGHSHLRRDTETGHRRRPGNRDTGWIRRRSSIGSRSDRDDRRCDQCGNGKRRVFPTSDECGGGFPHSELGDRRTWRASDRSN